MQRRQTFFFVGIVLLTLTSVLLTALWGNKPLLGLDLQGGVSVRLTAVEPADDEMLDQAVEIIRARVDGLGVAEPEISRTAQGVMVSLPGVDDQGRALELVGTTAELRFRPVCDTLPPLVEEVEPVVASGELGSAPVSCSPALNGEIIPATGRNGITPPEEDKAEHFVILTDNQGPEGIFGRRLLLGPSILTGDGLSGADADFVNFEWGISVTMKDGDQGIGAFNAIASECFTGTIFCPVQAGSNRGQVALVLDSQVITAPVINAPAFEKDAILISGAYEKQEAEDAALALRYGALPIELVAENTQLVSATIGEDSLEAGVIAGLIGLAVVAIFILLYYRLLGLIALLSLAISGSLLWAIISHLGTQSGLALTLAGITGIIVAIGVSVDSNVVYFEHLKEDIRDGRTARSAVDRAFKPAYSTIVKANTASLIGAGLLWWLTVGAVRGFALYLGLATILDLVATYFFMGPAIKLLSKTRLFATKPERFGLPAIGSVELVGGEK